MTLRRWLCSATEGCARQCSPLSNWKSYKLATCRPYVKRLKTMQKIRSLSHYRTKCSAQPRKLSGGGIARPVAGRGLKSALCKGQCWYYRFNSWFFLAAVIAIMWHSLTCDVMQHINISLVHAATNCCKIDVYFISLGQWAVCGQNTAPMNVKIFEFKNFGAQKE